MRAGIFEGGGSEYVANMVIGSTSARMVVGFSMVISPEDFVAREKWLYKGILG